MASFNSCTLVGRVVNEVEPPRVLGGSGTTVVKLRLAVGRGKKNPQTGQWERGLDQLYIDCEAFTRADNKRNLCDVISRLVSKGSEVLVHGKLQQDEWEDKNGGGKRTKHKIVIEDIEIFGAKSGGGEGGSQGGDGQQDDYGGNTPQLDPGVIPF